MYKLSKKNEEHLDKVFSELKQGILNVCVLHSHDSAPSMSKATFERAYIDKVVTLPIGIVSADIKHCTAALEQQKRKHLEELSQDENEEDKPL